MTTNVAKLRPRGPQRELPHLPPIARDPLDDAREVLAAFRAKQAGDSDIPYADLAEDLGAALRALLPVLTRPPAKPVLRPWTRLQVEQARQFVMELDVTAAGCDPLKAMFLLGRMTENCQRLLDVVDSVVQP
jgi:hypothetical protein